MEAFRKYLEEHYAQEKHELAKAMLLPDGAQQATQHRSALFVFAAGLIAYGCLEAAEDVLDGIPPSGSIRQLAQVLKALLPLPAELDPLHDPERIREWLAAHRHRLVWDEALGCYHE